MTSTPSIVLSNSPWNIDLASRLTRNHQRKFHLFTNKNDLSYEAMAEINPEWIFVPHWSHFIPPEIFNNWRTVIFHMTDLPYGRGGSPLQNLILRGHTSTVMTALLCSAEMDAGQVLLKEPLSLHGTAEEIYLRADSLVESMIGRLLAADVTSTDQVGLPVYFKRRVQSQSNLSECPNGDLKAWYDFIRMLDAQGYPHAYLEALGMKLEFRRVSQRSDGLYADVKISPKS